MDIARKITVIISLVLLAGFGLSGCGMGDFGSSADGFDAAEEAYVPPGELDKHYAFISGGQNGSVFVYGIPSGRLIRTIPIFEPEGSYGYGIKPGSPSWERLKETGGFWGDVHHPVLSETDGKYDGKHLYAHDKANNRVAKISLETFETEEIKNVPNIQGAHGLAVQSPNTNLLAVNGEYRHELEGELPKPENYKSMVAYLDPETLETKFEVLVPGQADINDSSKDGEWMFTTVYNTEEGLTITEMIQSDEDMIAAMHIPSLKEAVKKGEYTKVNGVPVIDPQKTSEKVMYSLPVPKNPHGCDVAPSGKYVMGSGKLSPTVSVYSIDKIDKVDNPEDALVAEPRVGLGPLHTTFDGRGNAYTSLFIDSQIGKWDIEKAVQAHTGKDVEFIEDKIDVHYNVGHTQAMEAESVDPAGDYLLSLNKLSKDQYVPVGPSMPESQEIIKIDGNPMRMVQSFPAEPEPHDAVFMRTERLMPKVKQKGIGEEDPDAVKQGDERVERTGPNSVHVYMTAVRSEFIPHTVEVKEGDKVTFTVTNVEKVKDVSHGFALEDYGLNVAIDPGQTKTFTIKADKPGTHWYYCTWFCSALHLEMRGRLIVNPTGQMARNSK